MVELVPLGRTAKHFDFAIEVKRLALGPYIAERWGWDEELQRANLALRWPDRAPSEIRLDGEPIGVLIANVSAGCVEIEDFYVLPRYQRRGIGTEVLNRILRQAQESHAAVHLRCLKWNPARDLYLRNGFFVISEDETHLHMERGPSTSNQPKVRQIFVAGARGEPMRSIGRVDAVTGKGLVGDRYFKDSIRRGPDYQVSLIEAEAIEEFTRELGLKMSPDMPRRNLVTVGVRLNEFLGKRFLVGNVLLEGLQLCEPCSLFATRTYPQILSFFMGRGGLRARIVVGGTICTGDTVAVAVSE